MADYVPDRKGMAQLAKSDDVGAAMLEAAEAGRRWAESAAPTDSGEYARSFQTRRETVRAGWSNEARAGAALENTAPHGGFVEYRHHVLARAVDAIERGW